MSEPPPIPNAPAPANSARAAATTWLNRRWRQLRPAVRQTWLNVKVWVPFLLNPADRARLATFMAREKRTGLEWEVRLPEQCWQCGRSDGLRERELERSVRSFEYALPIVGLSAMCVGFFLLIAWAASSWKIFLLAAISAIVGVAIIWIKSWPETVRVSMSACAEHAQQMRFPECVVDQGELYLFLPDARLASATVAMAKAERLKRQGFTPFAGGAPANLSSGASGGGTPVDDDDSDRPRYRPPPPRKPVELPPLKLDGDDEPG